MKVKSIAERTSFNHIILNKKYTRILDFGNNWLFERIPGRTRKECLVCIVHISTKCKELHSIH